MRARAALPDRRPRHHAVVGRWAVVADQGTGDGTGELAVLDVRSLAMVARRPLAASACVLPAPSGGG